MAKESILQKIRNALNPPGFNSEHAVRIFDIAKSFMIYDDGLSVRLSDDHRCYVVCINGEIGGYVSFWGRRTDPKRIYKADVCKHMAVEMNSELHNRMKLLDDVHQLHYDQIAQCSREHEARLREVADEWKAALNE